MKLPGSYDVTNCGHDTAIYVSLVWLSITVGDTGADGTSTRAYYTIFEYSLFPT